MRGRKTTILVLSLILAGLVLTAVNLYSAKDGEGVRGYKISVGDGVYCPLTRTGMLEMFIEPKTAGVKKLFSTSDDLSNDGSNEIINGRYLIRVSQGENTFLTLAREAEHTQNGQRLKVYFINKQGSYGEEPFCLTICEGIDEQVTEQIEARVEIDEKAVSFYSGDRVHVSATGVAVNMAEVELYDQKESSVASIRLKWEDQEKVLVFDQYAVEEKAVNGTEVVAPELIYNEGENRRYWILATELEDWQEIQTVRIGDKGIDRGDGKAEKTPEELKELYQKVLPGEVLEQYDSEITCRQLMEDPETYQGREDILLYGRVERVADVQGGMYQIEMIADDERLVAYVTDPDGEMEIMPGEKYVVGGIFLALDQMDGKPMIQVMVMEKL